jgi:hypothetical protein
VRSAKSLLAESPGALWIWRTIYLSYSAFALAPVKMPSPSDLKSHWTP